jgi:predicted GIY-YIG superfamily endonuclease
MSEVAELSTDTCVPRCRYWVYWLQATSDPRRCYVGATVNVARRLRQHNGELVGGARRTQGRGPWRVHSSVSGFRTWTETLQFEWALKYRFRRCRCVQSRETALQNLMVASKWTSNAPPAADVPLIRDGVRVTGTAAPSQPASWVGCESRDEKDAVGGGPKTKGRWRRALHGVRY